MVSNWKRKHSETEKLVFAETLYSIGGNLQFYVHDPLLIKIICFLFNTNIFSIVIYNFFYKFKIGHFVYFYSSLISLII